ncbi:MAG: hypothetical protein J0L73_03165 [Verrucomicrobia bacterium]|nr:hypothetical protein [Verrucomicrobiota bacterium]
MRAGASEARTTRQVRWIWAILLGGPAAVLLGSYVLLAIHHGVWNVFPVVVHENGRYTLTETIFYFRHFVRELPVNTLIAMGLGMLAGLHSPLERAGAAQGISACRRAGLAALLMAATAIVITWGQYDRNEAWTELAQYRTRDELAEFGSHWRYHLLHIVDSFLFCLGMLLVIRGLTNAGGLNRRALGWLAVLGVAFVMITLGFGSPLRGLTDPLYLAHQAREIETHRILTLCPAMACLLLIDLRLAASSKLSVVNRRMIWLGVGWIVLATLIPLWIIWRLREVNIGSLAQRQTGLWQIAAAHHFEHLLDSVYVTLLSVWAYLAVMRRRTSANSP